MARSHSIGDAQLGVRPYYSLLGKPQPVKADVELVQNIAVDVVKMQFIFEHCKADLTEVQNRYGVQITWIESTDSVTVLGLITLYLENLSQLKLMLSWCKISL